MSVEGPALERIVDALARRNGVNPRRVGGEWIALCPAHDDTHPSLGVRGIAGQVLVCCRSQGCPSDDIMAALNMSLADLYDDPKGAEYRYDDGRVVKRYYQAGRKKFAQSGTRNSTSQLYRLARVQAAVQRGETVWLVEGEKDVHALESMRVIATTAPQGAVNVSKCDLSPLHGAKMCIVPDQDDAGERWLSDVLATLGGKADSITVCQPMSGKDAADHIAAGYAIADFQRMETPTVEPELPERRIVLTPASAIPVRRVKWLWDGRMAVGTLALLAGPEGLGKSTLAYWTAARITRGQLPGEHYGTPQAVLVCATEDSWAHTIVPRLMAHDADLSMVYRVEVKRHDDITVGLSLPHDIAELRHAATETEAALLILDPLLSRLSEKLDSHKDADVRVALEPFVSVADEVNMAILGLIHHNKSGSSDPLSLVMASKAFTAVARSVHTVIKDPDDEDELRRLFGTPKNNLGRIDLPVLSFTIRRWAYDTDEGEGDTGQLAWGADVDGTISDAIRRAAEDPNVRTAITEACDWLGDYMHVNGPRVSSGEIRKASDKAGHAIATVHRARRKLGLVVEFEGFPRESYWVLPDDSDTSGHPLLRARGDGTTDTTDTTGQSGQGKEDEPIQGTLPPMPESGHSPESPPIGSRASRISGIKPPRARGQQEQLDASDNCTQCGWPLDSQGHETNCGGSL